MGLGAGEPRLELVRGEWAADVVPLGDVAPEPDELLPGGGALDTLRDGRQAEAPREGDRGLDDARVGLASRPGRG